MGEQYQFKCPGCSYHAMVGGGMEAGEMIIQTTIVCEDCRRLYDVVTHSTSGQGKEYPARCPRSEEHKIKIWVAGDCCPQCGRPMVKGDLCRLWD